LKTSQSGYLRFPLLILTHISTHFSERSDQGLASKARELTHSNTMRTSIQLWKNNRNTNYPFNWCLVAKL